MRRRSPRFLMLASWLLSAALLPAGGCSSEAARPDAAGPGAPVHAVVGFDQPESVKYDPEQDVYFVSSMAGYGSAKDSVGYIARVSASDPERADIFLESGRNGVFLHAPKGMALQGDTLWVADIDVLRGFDRRTGAPLVEVDLAPRGALLLNAIALDSAGTVYVTDTGIVMSDKGVLYSGAGRIFAVAPGGEVSLVAEGAWLRYPNGVAWEEASRRLIVASFNPFGSEIYSFAPGDTSRRVLARGPGRFDGLALLADGRLLATSWADSSLYVIADGGQERPVRGLWQPADLGVDTRRNRVAIPLVLPGRVELWPLPPR